MKEKYVSPAISVEELGFEDVICTSSVDNRDVDISGIPDIE